MPLTPEIYARRRRAFMDQIGPTAAALVPAAPAAVRSHDVDYPYRQDNDFLYLTGFPEPEAVCLLLPNHPTEEYILFVRPRDPDREVWTGRRTGVEGARERYGAAAAFPIDTLDAKIHDYVAERDVLYYAFARHLHLNDRVLAWMRHWYQLRPRSGHGPVALLDPGEILHELRLRKEPEEIARMRQAIAIAAQAHLAAMAAARDGAYEYEVEALIDGSFRRHGASGPAYPSIVASGRNATILHYTSNDAQMHDGDLLLIDAGAEVDGYCSDITRTFPVGLQYSGAQRAIYDLVLAAQQAAIALIRPGVPIDAPHARAVDVLVDGLLDLGLLRGDRQEILAKEQYKPFFMHRTSHWLGMDVHDVGKYKVRGEARVLEAGMVLTVEPGLYIAEDAAAVAPHYRGIGVRIEDDILVTADGCEVLSAAIPQQPADICAIRGRARADA